MKTWFTNRSIRLRLTLIYSAILGLTLILFSVAIFAIQIRLTMVETREILTDRGRRMTALIQAPLPENFEPPPQIQGNSLIQLRDFDGNVIEDPIFRNMMSPLPLSQEGIESVQNGEPWVDVTMLEDKPHLIYTFQTVTRNNQPILVQLGHSLEERAAFLALMRNAFMVGSLIATVAAFGIGWWLAGWTLRPINKITQTAQSIGAERDFSQRVNHQGPLDEIGHLATTFNNMLTELEEAFGEKEHALQTQHRFVADASHELRTPLTTLRGNIGLLQRQPPILEEDRVEILDDMVDETERLIRLVNDLLTLARADAGRELRQEPVPLQPLLQGLCHQFQATAQHHLVQCNQCSEVTVLGDKDALKQVCLILLDNARKHTPPQTKISLDVTSNHNQVTITVKDNGPGISPDRLPHIFDRFYRGDSARTGDGAGLGLAIAQDLVVRQGGEIAVTSVMGEGTSFEVRLPQIQSMAG